MEFIAPPILHYQEAHSTPEPPLLKKLYRETHLKVLYPRMLSGHLQGRLLSIFSKLMQPRLVVELGTYTGYSALCLSEGLHPEGKLITIEQDPELKIFAQPYFDASGKGDQIEMRIGKGLDVLPDIEGPIDMAFLDADKENYFNYYEMLLPKIRQGGLILADNVLWSGHVMDPSVQDKETNGLRNFANLVAKDDRVEKVVLTVRDGLMVIRKL